MSQITNQEIPAKPTALNNGEFSLAQVSSAGQLTYHELEEVSVRSVDALEQLQRNMVQLSMVRSRLQFMLREIRYQLKV